VSVSVSVSVSAVSNSSRSTPITTDDATPQSPGVTMNTAVDPFVVKEEATTLEINEVVKADNNNNNNNTHAVVENINQEFKSPSAPAESAATAAGSAAS